MAITSRRQSARTTVLTRVRGLGCVASRDRLDEVEQAGVAPDEAVARALERARRGASGGPNVECRERRERYDRGSPRSFGPPSTKAKYAALIATDMSRKFKLVLALVLVVLAYRLFVGGDTEVVEYETSD